MRGRRATDRALADSAATQVHVTSHTAGLLISRRARRGRAVWLLVDATIDQWEGQDFKRAVRHWTAAVLAPSRLLERRAFQAASGVLAMSAWSASGVSRACPGARVRVLHPGIDLDHWRPRPLPSRPAEVEAARPARVLFVGGRFREKGGEDLLAALAPQLGHEVELDIVTAAEVPERPGVRVHRLQREDPALLRLYQAADVFVLPSHGDAVPWTVLEAMATGTPVVGSDVGAIPELIGTAGERGLVVPRRDPRRLREAVAALVGDPARLRALRSPCRAHVEAHFDVHRQGRVLSDLLTASAQSTT